MLIFCGFFVYALVSDTRLYIRLKKKVQAISSPNQSTINILFPDQYAKKYHALHSQITKSDIALSAFMEKIDYPIYTNLLMSDWDALLFASVFQSIYIPVEVTGEKRDAYYHISHSRYALLHFSIYAHFNFWHLLCDCPEKIHVIYHDRRVLDFMEFYYAQYFDMDRAKINDIIKSMWNQYEQIEKNTPEHEVIQECAALFLRVLPDAFSEMSLFNSQDIFTEEQLIQLTHEIEITLLAYIYKMRDAINMSPGIPCTFPD